MSVCDCVGIFRASCMLSYPYSTLMLMFISMHVQNFGARYALNVLFYGWDAYICYSLWTCHPTRIMVNQRTRQAYSNPEFGPKADMRPQIWYHLAYSMGSNLARAFKGIKTSHLCLDVEWSWSVFKQVTDAVYEYFWQLARIVWWHGLSICIWIKTQNLFIDPQLIVWWNMMLQTFSMCPLVIIVWVCLMYCERIRPIPS